MEKTSINLTPLIVQKADEFVSNGKYENRSHAIRKTLMDAWGITPPETDNAPTPHPPE